MWSRFPLLDLHWINYIVIIIFLIVAFHIFNQHVDSVIICIPCYSPKTCLGSGMYHCSVWHQHKDKSTFQWNARCGFYQYSSKSIQPSEVWRLSQRTAEYWESINLNLQKYNLFKWGRVRGKLCSKNVTFNWRRSEIECLINNPT